LPHSIIVTEGGVEGEVAAVPRAEAAEEPAGPVESDLLGDAAPPARKSVKPARQATQQRRAMPAAGARRKSDQMALFDRAAGAKAAGKQTRVQSKPRPRKR
jgi:hypothetical protein